MFGRRKKGDSTVTVTVSEFFDRKTGQLKQRKRILVSRLDNIIRGEHRHYFSKQDLLTKNHSWSLSGVALIVFLVFLVVGSLTAGYSPEHPRPNGVAYLMDVDAGNATWFSGGTQQDNWNRQFFNLDPKIGVAGELFPITKSSRFPIMSADVPQIALSFLPYASDRE